MAHTFEYNGITVEYSPPIVRTRQTRNRLMTKLLMAHGYDDAQSIPDSDYESLNEYATVIARSCARGASWWVDSDASLEDVRKGYEAFMNEDERLYDLLVIAGRATEPPKKTNTNTETTLE